MNGNRPKPIPQGVIWGLVAALGLVILGMIVTTQAIKSRSDLPRYGKVTAFNFAKADGGSFSDRDLKGKISVVDFIYTGCGDLCPMMTQRMTELYRLYAGSQVVQFVSITVDPEHDTPEVLSAYAKETGVTDSRWVFLTGPQAEVANLSEHGFLLSAQDLPEGHSKQFILLDRQGWIRGYYDGTGNMAVLADHIKMLAKAKS